VEPNLRTALVVSTRIAAMVTVAGLLILVLLPAALAASSSARGG
jgi:hypothetical protein